MTDFYKMSSMMKDLFPSNPEDDKKALMNMVNRAPEEVANKDYIAETASVKEGSLSMDKDYSITDFAKLAGVTEAQKTGPEGQLKGKDAFTKSSTPGGNESPHPARDKLVGEKDTNDLRRGVNILDLGDDPASLVTAGLINAVQGDTLPMAQREALQPYVGLFVTIMKNPRLLSRLNAMKRIVNKTDKEIDEKAVSKKQQQFFGIVRAMQKGDMPKGGEAGKVAGDISKKDAKDFASTKHKNLPNKKTESIKQELYKILNATK